MTGKTSTGDSMEREFTDGSRVLTRAAKTAGCNFYAGYPISPSTRIHNSMMREIPAAGGIALQGEDEIASISLCIAASMAGKKALTSTSGPGMSLYSESIGLALMGEVPLVIVDVQRLGPATGGATTGSQGDLWFAGHPAPGGIPVPVLSPSSPESLHRLTIHAFNVSEALRTPVILLTSKEMVMARHTYNRDDLETPEIINRKYHLETGEFAPYQVFEASDIPLFLPVGSQIPVRFTTSMHDEKGYLTKDKVKVEKKLRHLTEKIMAHEGLIESADDEIQEGAEILVISYGISSGASREAVSRFRERGGLCSLLIIESLFPEPGERITAALTGIKKVIVVEMNSGLYAEIIKKYLKPGQKLIRVNRIDGGLISPEQILEEGPGS
jgi:2-oxoglutarate ferredoxin oxidoreductase subunit alpha